MKTVARRTLELTVLSHSASLGGGQNREWAATALSPFPDSGGLRWLNIANSSPAAQSLR